MSLVRVAAFALLGLSASAQRADATAQSQPTAPLAQADTLHYQVRAGQALLVALPVRVGNAEASYAVVSAPAMSWLVDRSFMWQTIPSERGLMQIVFRQTAASAETLVLMVEVTE